jgi:hypothetical protein
MKREAIVNSNQVKVRPEVEQTMRTMSPRSDPSNSPDGIEHDCRNVE